MFTASSLERCIMKKAEFVMALNQFHNGTKFDPTHKGQTTLARFLAQYFDQLVIPADQKYDFWTIDHYIPVLLLEATKELRTSNSQIAQEVRAEYESKLGRAFPDLTVLGPVDIIGQSMTRMSLQNLIEQVTGEEWVGREIQTLFTAEQTLLTQRFYAFVSQVHRTGMYELIYSSSSRGMNGQFASTALRSYVIAGRLMYTFTREKDTYEENVTFVCQEDDPLAMSAGLHRCSTNLETALSMFEDVIKEWPLNERTQAALFVADKAVVLG